MCFAWLQKQFHSPLLRLKMQNEIIALTKHTIWTSHKNNRAKNLSVSQNFSAACNGPGHRNSADVITQAIEIQQHVMTQTTEILQHVITQATEILQHVKPQATNSAAHDNPSHAQKFCRISQGTEFLQPVKARGLRNSTGW